MLIYVLLWPINGNTLTCRRNSLQSLVLWQVSILKPGVESSFEVFLQLLEMYFSCTISVGIICSDVSLLFGSTQYVYMRRVHICLHGKPIQ
jgi:hypothetical protein